MQLGSTSLVQLPKGEKNGEVSHGRKNGHQLIKEKRNGITLSARSLAIEAS
jgi:hypothetical protein